MSITSQQRIQKILSERGVCSRRKAEEHIKDGKVTVNGKAAQLGDSADAELDAICVEGTPIPSAQKNVYIMLHKPRGYVTTLSDEKGRKTAASLVTDCGARVYPVGRLDMDSEGLLLFTNDGEFANRVMHPAHVVNKTYEVEVQGYTEEHLILLRNPIELDGYLIKPPSVELISANKTRTFLRITIHEGRNRQIRRMCEAAQMRVTRLKRVQEGSLRLGNLAPGKWRYLTEDEVTKI